MNNIEYEVKWSEVKWSDNNFKHQWSEIYKNKERKFFNRRVCYDVAISYPLRNSYNRHPKAHKSEAYEYIPSWDNNSGDKYAK